MQTNKLNIKVAPALMGNGYKLTVGTVSIITSRKNLQATYNNLLSRPLVESLARYARARSAFGCADTHLKSYLAGRKTTIFDSQLTY